MDWSEAIKDRKPIYVTSNVDNYGLKKGYTYKAYQGVLSSYQHIIVEVNNLHSKFFIGHFTILTIDDVRNKFIDDICF